jgi:predicted LPLAT superfamily acyltransferase
MPLWEGKSKGSPAGYRFFVWILKNFGVLPAYFILRFVALYYFLFSKASREIYGVYRKLGYGKLTSVFRVYQNHYLVGQSIIDKVVVMSGIPNKFSYNFDGENHLHEIIALKKGGVLLSAHIGNWDIAGYLLKRLNTRINILIFDGEEQQIKEYLTTITGPQSVNIISIKNDLSHIYEISEAFKNNELLCMHADRFLEGSRTVTNDFLGEKARFPMGPFVLASTFKVPVSYVFALKESNFHYHFFASEIKNYGHLEKGSVVPQMLKDYTYEMEIKVKKYPGQWFNFYNFWHQ